MYFHCLTVKIVVIIIGEVALASRSWSTAAGSVREAEVVAEATCLLQSLTEHLVLLDIIVRHRPREKNSSTKISNKILFRPSGKLHCLLEVSLGDLWNWIIVIINIHSNTLKDDNMINDEAQEKMNHQRYLSNMGKVLEDNV